MPEDGGGPTTAGTDVVVAALHRLRPVPSPQPLLRLGGDTDGAYLVPDDLDGIVACFSPGVEDRKAFEDDLVDHFGISCHLCDGSTDPAALATALRPGLQTLERRWLEPDDGPDAISLDTWVNRYAPGDGDLLLQMDIEGAEYRTLLGVSDALLRRFRILVVELHGLDAVTDPVRFDAGAGALIERLSRHFAVVHVHANNCCGQIRYRPARMNVPRVLEVTWLRRDRFPAGGRSARRGPRLPHPLDIRNVAGKPAIRLSRAWHPRRRRPQVL